MLILSAFGITVTTTAPNTGVSKVMTVDNGKVYELNFNTHVLSSSVVEVNIKELGSTIVSQQISTNGNHALTFTPTSNAITIEFNRINSGTASLQFEVDNIQLKEVISSELTNCVGEKSYELKDRIGNIRVVISNKKFLNVAKVKSATDVYPFGVIARRKEVDKYRFLLNGKEFDEKFGTAHDFDARIYLANLGRWMSLDPLSKEYPMLSNYAYVDNSPLILVDHDGRRIVIDDGINTYDYTPGANPPKEASDFVKQTFKNLNTVIANDQSKNKMAKSRAMDLVKSDKILKLMEVRPGQEMGYYPKGPRKDRKLSKGSEKAKLGIIYVDNNLVIEEAKLDESGTAIINKDRKSVYNNYIKGGKKHTATRLLFHEVTHAWHKNFDFKAFKRDRLNKKTAFKNLNTGTWTNNEEKRTILEMNEIIGDDRCAHKANKISPGPVDKKSKNVLKKKK